MGDKLAGKSIVITGGTKGVGRGVALAAAMAGADITFAGRDDQAAADVLADIRRSSGRNAQYVRCDLRQPVECRQLMAAAETTFGGIDGLFNYAGILPSSTLLDTPEQMFDDVFAIDIKGPFFCCQYALPSMIRRGGGSIVNTGSIHAYAGEIDRAAYACAKGALLTLTKTHRH